MVGIGPVELLIVVLTGLLALGVPIAIIVLLILLLRKQKDAERDSILASQLREENERLRDELRSKAEK